MTIGECIQQARKKAGLSQKEVAEKLGYTTHSSIFKIEAGKQELPITMVPAICKALSCTPFELLGLRPEGDILIQTEPGIETLIERINRLPATQRHQLEHTVDLLIKGMEGMEGSDQQ